MKNSTFFVEDKIFMTVIDERNIITNFSEKKNLHAKCFVVTPDLHACLFENLMQYHSM